MLQTASMQPQTTCASVRDPMIERVGGKLINKHQTLRNISREQQQDQADYLEAKVAYATYLAEGEQGIPFEHVFEHVK